MSENLDWRAWDILVTFVSEHEEAITIVAMEFGHDDESAEAIAARLISWVRNQEPPL